MPESRTDDGAPPERVEVWNEEQIQAWQEYDLGGMVDLISSANLCQALQALGDSGLLERLDSAKLASREQLLAGLEPTTGAGFLRYLTLSGILDERQGRYRLSRRGQFLTNPVALARLGFYTRAYAPVLTNLTGLLTGRLKHGTDVRRDDTALGQHCGAVATVSYTSVVLEALSRAPASRLLDLGCGSGALILELCRERPGLTGIGIDLGAGPVGLANRRASEQGLAERAAFLVADAFRPETWPDACREAQMITSVGVLHELYRDGEDAVIDLLNGYAKILTDGQLLLVGEPELRYDHQANDSDFYLVHAMTSQGIPRDSAGWFDVFRKSELRCRRVYVNAVAGPRTCFYELVLHDSASHVST